MGDGLSVMRSCGSPTISGSGRGGIVTTGGRGTNPNGDSRNTRRDTYDSHGAETRGRTCPCCASGGSPRACSGSCPRATGTSPCTGPCTGTLCLGHHSRWAHKAQKGAGQQKNSQEPAYAAKFLP